MLGIIFDVHISQQHLLMSISGAQNKINLTLLRSCTGNINRDKLKGYDSLDTCVCWRPSGVAALLPVVEATPVYKNT